jgi:hypothetical protein
MPESVTSMLYRLFPSPVTIASFSPEFFLTRRAWKRAINCGDVGMSSNCPNYSDRHFFLWVLIEYRMMYEHSAFQELFRMESDEVIQAKSIFLQRGGLHDNSKEFYHRR